MIGLLGMWIRGCTGLGGFILVRHVWNKSVAIALYSTSFPLEAYLDTVEDMVDMRAKLASNNKLAIKFSDETTWDGKKYSDLRNLNRIIME